MSRTMKFKTYTAQRTRTDKETARQTHTRRRTHTCTQTHTVRSEDDLVPSSKGTDPWQHEARREPVPFGD